MSLLSVALPYLGMGLEQGALVSIFSLAQETVNLPDLILSPAFVTPGS